LAEASSRSRSNLIQPPVAIKVNRHDVRFTHVGNLEAMETRVAGFFGRDQVNLRTAQPEIVQDSGQLDLLDAVAARLCLTLRWARFAMLLP
jgi:hypothetical protein